MPEVNNKAVLEYCATILTERVPRSVTWLRENASTQAHAIALKPEVFGQGFAEKATKWKQKLESQIPADGAGAAIRADIATALANCSNGPAPERLKDVRKALQTAGLPPAKIAQILTPLDIACRFWEGLVVLLGGSIEAIDGAAAAAEAGLSDADLAALSDLESGGGQPVPATGENDTLEVLEDPLPSSPVDTGNLTGDAAAADNFAALRDEDFEAVTDLDHPAPTSSASAATANSKKTAVRTTAASTGKAGRPSAQSKTPTDAAIPSTSTPGRRKWTEKATGDYLEKVGGKLPPQKKSLWAKLFGPKEKKRKK